MTLVRKSIITNHIDWHRIYALSLWINVFVYWSFYSIRTTLYIVLGGIIFTYFRVEKRFNKYLIWNIIFMGIYLVESIWDTEWELEPKTNKIINNSIIFYLFI